MDYNYLSYLKNSNFQHCSLLKKLPKLSIKDIQKYDEPYKMALLFFYGYSSMYKKYELVDLNRYIDKYLKTDLYLFLVSCEKIKEFKYLVSKGINIHKFDKYNYDAYLISVHYGNIKLVKYLESIGVNIHKKLYNGSNAYLIATLKGHTKLMKHLEKKGANIYIKIIYGHHKNLGYYGLNYEKIAPYFFKNKNYKLNRYKILYI